VIIAHINVGIVVTVAKVAMGVAKLVSVVATMAGT
jgi:hypothetical protein